MIAGGLRGFGRWLGRTANNLSERLAGSERRFRYGADGLVKLPAMAADSLMLAPSARQHLADSRVYLIHGTPWPGVDRNGAAWVEPWARKLEELGVGRAVPVVYGGKSSLLAHIRVFLEPLFRFDERRVLKVISRDLANAPLRPGERIALVGHSYGSRLTVPVAEKLQARGLPVSAAVLMEDRVPAPIGQFVKRAPAIRRVLEIENDPGKPLATTAGTVYKRLVAPELTHMDFVLEPPAKIFDAVLKEIAAR